MFAAVGLAFVFGFFFFLAFLIGVGLPAWWLGYLALLARPSTAGDALEWYPAGHLVVWAALVGALVVMAALPSFGTDEATLRATLRSGVERVLRMQMRTPANAPLELPGRADINRVVDILLLIIPPVAPCSRPSPTRSTSGSRAASSNCPAASSGRGPTSPR